MNQEEWKNHLLSKGWAEGKDGRWVDPIKSNRNSFGFACKIQEEYDLIDKNGVFYCLRQNRYGYGFEIIKNSNKQKPVYELTEYTHIPEEQAREYVNILNDKREILPVLLTKFSFDLIAIFKEKHGSRYFYVPTLQDLERVALKIVLERKEDGWYDFSCESKDLPYLTKEQINTMPDSQTKRAALEEWERYELNIKYSQKNSKLESLLKEVIEENNGEKALKFLDMMKKGEYEGLEIVESESY